MLMKGGEVYIHIFVFCTSSFFSNQIFLLKMKLVEQNIYEYTLLSLINVPAMALVDIAIELSLPFVQP